MNRLMLLPATLVTAFFAATSFGAPGGPGRAPLDVYTVELAAGEVGDLVREGFDVSAARTVNAQTEVDLVLTAAQQSRLEKRGLTVRLKRNKDGKTARQAAAAQAAAGFSVWRSWDEPGGIRDELRALARDNPQLVKLVTLARTHQGREILGLKLTQGARGMPDGTRPAVLYSSLQHAREWISVEVNRRLLRWYVDRWRANDTEVKRLLKDTELWFIVVANPDGYQYTFDVERLWRKNLRDNDGDGQTTILDGVDPNRNYPEHWRYDEEGSSSLQSSETYRGPVAGSEPETQAVMGLYARVPFRFHVNYHSAGQWLLYPEGWQIGTPSADDPIYFALSGNLDRPAIADFQPGLSSDVLYVTNGETTDWAYSTRGSLAWTPELSEGCDGCGFVFPDDDALVQAEFERNLPFALSVARSVEDPDDPKSVLGTTTKPFYLRSDDTYKAGLPGANFTFETSYGDPQPVQVLAKRSLGAVTLKYRVNGGAVRSAPTAEWAGGERYGGPGFYYHVVRGAVTGTAPGDSVEVWFEGGGARSESFTYTAVAESGRRVLVVSAEDYSGASPVQAPGPHYLQYYLDALAANGTAADVYDVDARGRRAPDHLGVLSHYDSVIWYTGDDVVTRKLGWGGGQRGPDRDGRAAAIPRVHERGRPRGLHGQERGQPVQPGARNAALRSDRGERTVPCRPSRRAALHRALRLGRRDERRAPVLARRLPPERGRRRRPRHRGSVRRGRRRRSARRHLVVAQRAGQRRQSGQRELVHRGERHPAALDVPAVRELGGGEVRPAGRAVRPAHRRSLPLVADRRRLVQTARADDERAGRRRLAHVLDVLRHRAALGSPLRRGAHGRAGRLDDAPRRERPHEPGHR